MTGRRRLDERQTAAGAAPGLGAALALALATGEAWIVGRGWSMFPTSPPGGRVRVLPRRESLRIGQVVVFERGGRLIAHRLVERSERGWIAKGDGAVACDPPLQEAAILGVADAVRFAGRTLRLEADPGRAFVSRRLGLACQAMVPAPLAPLCYLAAFTAALAWRASAPGP